MRSLPVADPGIPDARSPLRYLWWVARVQAAPLLTGVALAILWWLGQALVPAALGRAVDAVSASDTGALARWSAVVLALGVVQAVGGVMRHRYAVFTWLGAAYRTVQVTNRQATRLGATLPKRLSTGEVVSVGNSDIVSIGNAMDILLRGTGALVAVATVTVILLATSLPLGLMVLIGVPVMAAAVGPLLRPLHHRQHAHRELQAELATRASDIVAGLRVLRGIGGEQVFADRYRDESQRVRRAGVRVSSVESLLEGAQVLLPGVLIAGVTWLGAHFALDGKITAGQLVAFYSYAVFLIAPLRTLTEAADKLTKGHVAARRICHILTLTPEITDRSRGGAVAFPIQGDLADAASGVVVRAGRFTALATAVPEEAAAIADRLGRYTDPDAESNTAASGAEFDGGGSARGSAAPRAEVSSKGASAPGAEGGVAWGVTLDGRALGELPLADVRRHILVADNAAKLFTGRLRDTLDPYSHPAEPDDSLEDALYAACAEDIVAALPGGLDAHVAESGREFSGGQQQRLRLARALIADPEILILVEPTSAVDAHTEARIAERLAKARAGRTTLVCSTSPLVLDHADHVLYVDDGQVRAEGTHRELLAAEPGYRSTVTRGEE